MVSNANVADFPDIAEGLAALGADSYIAEPAEERVELQTMDTGITPGGSGFATAAAAVLVNEKEAQGTVAKMARALRGEYYGRVVRFLDGDVTAMPVCHAGFISVHIVADGEVWSCCVLARSFGNLRDHDFDFKKVWFSPAAEEFRSWMRERRCACPLANAAYTNMLVEPGAASADGGQHDQEADQGPGVLLSDSGDGRSSSPAGRGSSGRTGLGAAGAVGDRPVRVLVRSEEAAARVRAAAPGCRRSCFDLAAGGPGLRARLPPGRHLPGLAGGAARHARRGDGGAAGGDRARRPAGAPELDVGLRLGPGLARRPRHPAGAVVGLRAGQAGGRGAGAGPAGRRRR